MNECTYKNYDELPLMLNVVQVAAALGISRAGAKAGRISDSEFYAWSEQAREQKKKCNEGIITAEEFQRWLKES